MMRSRRDIEREWYGRFAKWTKAERAVALNVLTVLHDQLPENPKVIKDSEPVAAQLPMEAA